MTPGRKFPAAQSKLATSYNAPFDQLHDVTKIGCVGRRQLGSSVFHCLGGSCKLS